jgi:hypothetical protein
VNIFTWGTGIDADSSGHWQLSRLSVNNMLMQGEYSGRDEIRTDINGIILIRRLGEKHISLEPKSKEMPSFRARFTKICGTCV